MPGLTRTVGQRTQSKGDEPGEEEQEQNVADGAEERPECVPKIVSRDEHEQNDEAAQPAIPFHA
jgi:hypothetical protein